MATLNITNTFTNGTAANATEVNQNFTDVKTFVEGSLVHADGTVQAGSSAIATNAIVEAKIAAGAVTEAKLASALIQLLTPTGSISQYGGASAPTGWLLCDGQELSIASYTALYNVLTTNGTVFPYGANTNGSGGAGSTHFRLPNFKGRIPVGLDSGQTEFDTLGETGGAKTVTLTENQSGLRSHTHTTQSHTHVIDDNTEVGSTYATGGSRYAMQYDSTAQTFNSGSTTVVVNSVAGASATEAHNNLQPYIVLNYIIKH